MKNHRRFLILAVCVVMVATVFAGCGSSNAPAANPGSAGGSTAAASSNAPAAGTEQAASPKSTKDILILANRNDVGTLAPYNDTLAPRGRVTMNIYDNLFIEENDGTLTPTLATSWEWTDDTHLVFKLREGVVFSNGNPFNADDVLFTYQYASKSTIKDQMNMVDFANCRVIDEYTFELALNRPDVRVISQIGHPSLMNILDKETCEANPDAMATDPVGTGPYKLKEWVNGDSVTLVRNEKYWGEPAKIGTLIFRNIPEATQRTIEMETGGVDVVYDLQSTAAESLDSMPGINVITQPGLMVQFIYFNVTDGHPFGNIDLRKAIAYATNSGDIVKGAFDGGGNPPATFASRSAIGFDKLKVSGEFYPQDLTKAKEHMAAAGYANGLTLNILVDDNAKRVASVEIIQNQLKQIGITLNVMQYDFGTALGMSLNPSNDWDLFMLADGNSTALMQCERMDKNSAPFQTYSSDKLQGMIEQLFSSNDKSKQDALFADIGAYFQENVPFVPYCEEIIQMAVPENLKGFDIFQGIAVKCKDLYFE